MPSAPLTTSTHSGRQLQPVHSAPQKQRPLQEKENQAYFDERNDAGEQSTAVASVSVTLPPRTPAGKISLSDLTANPEDVLNGLLPLGTPIDQVTWKHVPGCAQTPSSSFRTTQRGTKRARSSSPSSQTTRSKHFRGNDDLLDMRSMSQSLQRSPTHRSPNNDDPAAALWNHYTERRGNEPTLPPMIPLQLSPHTPNDGNKEANLRRAHSCTNEWPSSSAKKRKLEVKDQHSTTKDIFASRKQEILRPEATRQTRVNLLLESVQQSMAARRIGPEGPSSSSPVPERAVGFANVTQPLLPRPEAFDYAEEPPKSISETMDQNSFLVRKDNSSDYGDLDLNDEDLEVLAGDMVENEPGEEPEPESAKDAKATQKSSLRPLQKLDSRDVKSHFEWKEAPDEPGLENTATSHNTPDDEQSQTYSCHDFDEFVDDDDDNLEQELRKLAATLDSQEVRLQPAQVSLNKSSPSKHSKAQRLMAGSDGACDDDEFNDDDLWNDIEAMNVFPASEAGTKSQGTQDNRLIKRYLIVDVLTESFEVSPGRRRSQKVLALKDERSRTLCSVILRDSWCDSRCTKDSYLHLVGKFDEMGRCIVDDSKNMVILHPDHLISATVIGDAINCLRRATLQDRVKATSPPTKPQVYGHMLHEIFGEAMRQNDWEMDNFQKIIERLIPTYLEALYEIGVQVSHAIEHLMSKVPLLKGWAEVFVNAKPLPDAVIRDRQGALVPTAINKLLELEEHVWSPMYGLKGNIDATVQARMQLPGDPLAKTLVVPLELKTGMKDSNDSHRAQTALYTLLLSDRYDVEVTSGILYYLETSKTFRVASIRNEIRQLIIWRNELACYVHDKLDLPPMIKREHLCKKCYAQTACFTYHKLVEDGDGTTSGLGDFFTDAVAHLRPMHQVFFRKWDQLLTKEERDSMKFKRELWTMLSTEREQLGRCFANVKIESGSAFENPESSKINRYTYSFIKQTGRTGFSFAESQITAGEPIVISDEIGHFALANGFVTHVRPTRITVAVDRKLQQSRRKSPNFDAETNQSFCGIMDVASGSSSKSLPSSANGPILYRIDKDEFSNGMATVRNNLIRLMEKGLFRVKELRELIIEQKAPSFKHVSTAYTLSGPASQQNLNVDQKAAIDKVMSAKDYALVLGMPGTGKTTTIAHIIRALVSQGKSVLLTSYTHTAVDNILLKIRDDNIPILRLGSVGKVHPEVQKFVDLSGIPKKTMGELEASWSDSKVVATTCLSINHGIFNHRVFDYCIVDEASQITLPVCLGPIRFAHTFILVGDHYQLPPLVQSKEAQDGGLDVSLFKLLSDTQPDSVVNLEHQYRMAEDIMSLSNLLIYNGRLKCGTELVASRSLVIPSLEIGLEAHHHNSSSYKSGSCSINNADCWIRRALEPTTRALFLSTDSIAYPSVATEKVHGARITNQIESFLVAQLLTVLVRAGVPPRNIGVITFYRSQLALLKRDVKSTAGTATAADVEMHTADKYQGRDKEVVILSCVRSNQDQHVGELLRDWRRVNVALTRAKSKLLIIGSQRTMEGSGVQVLEGLVQIMKSKRWMMDLPVAATEGHAFESAVSQTQMMANPVLSSHRPGTWAKSRSPLQPIDANRASNGKPSMRKPSKVIQGTLDVENLLDKRPVLRDVVNELV